MEFIANVEDEFWRLQRVIGDASNLRYRHGVDSDGNTFAIFGNEDASGLEDGLYETH